MSMVELRSRLDPETARQEYQVGEKTLAYHQFMIYEARVLKKEIRVDEKTGIEKPMYFVHYLGWNDRWDEWVDSTRLLKDNEANRKFQEEIKEETKRTKSKSKKRKLDSDNPLDSKFKIEIPLSLRRKLVEDSDFITNQKYLIHIPRTPNVNDILDGFLDTLTDTQLAKYEEAVTGIREYFNKSLGNFLLYRFERNQYGEVLKKYPNKKLCEIYGFEHLLRLFVKLPYLLAAVEIEDDAIHIIKFTSLEILKYLVNNLPSFPNAYEPADPTYIKTAQ